VKTPLARALELGLSVWADWRLLFADIGRERRFGTPIKQNELAEVALRTGLERLWPNTYDRPFFRLDVDQHQRYDLQGSYAGFQREFERYTIAA
jgi:hypothetical protein